jgi:hypothetical protein
VSTRPFISYAHEDRDVAIWLHAELTAVGAEPWLDAVNLIAGEDWELAIEHALTDATHVIALISKRSVNKRGYVQKELRKALALLEEWPPGTSFVIPVRLDESKPLHPMLQRLHWVNLFDNPGAGFRRLIAAMGLVELKPHASESSMPGFVRGYPDIPPEILAPIVSRAERLGDDLKARGSYVQREIDAWRSVTRFDDSSLPSEVRDRIIANLAHMYPDSIAERRFILPREVACWKLLQTIRRQLGRDERFTAISKRAKERWPRSFAGQYYCVVAELQNWEDAF